MERPLDIRTLPRTPVPISEQHEMDEFWRKRQEEIETIKDFGERAIPMTRLKKVICAEKGEMMMTFDTPSFLTKACEIFVQELAFRAWRCADSHHRCIILESDIAEAIASTESYDFLNDVLHAYLEECNSIPQPKPSKKRYKRTDQQSTSHHPSPLQYQVPHVGPQFSRYAPHVPIPPLPPTHVNHVPLYFSFIPQQAPPSMATTVTPTPILNKAIPPINCMGMGLGFFRNKINFNKDNIDAPRNYIICNNLLASTVMTPPMQVSAGAMPNIPNTCHYMNMTDAFAAAYGVGYASTSNVATQEGVVALQFPYNPPIALQMSSHSQTDSNGAGTATTSIKEMNHVPSEAINISNTIHASDCAINDDNVNIVAAISVSDGQLQQDQEEEAVIGHRLNDVHENFDTEVATAAGAGGNDYIIKWDEVEMADGPSMDKFWDEVMIQENTLLPNAAPADDIPQLSTDIPDLEGFNNEPYLLEDIVSCSSTNAGQPN
ncbi:hypothetical protein ACP70R_045520 [Stipagrostis hirtigluma subsp. patula]